MQLERVRQEAYALPWAILQKTLKDMLRRLSAAEEPRDPQAALQSRQVQAAGKVAVLSLSGIIMPRASFMLEFFGATSTEQFAQAFDDAIANPDTRPIAIDRDPPARSLP